MLTKNIDRMKNEVQAHIADAAMIESRFGMPLPLVRICESIFETLPKAEAVDFFAAIPESIGRDGRDLTRVHWRFLSAELRALPVIASDTQAVIAGMDLLAAGEDWPDAKDVADAAARAATRETAFAARAAARAAAFAARAAADAAFAARAAAFAAAFAARAAADAAALAAADAAALAAADAAALAAADAAADAAALAAADAAALAAADAAALAADATARQRDLVLRLLREA